MRLDEIAIKYNCDKSSLHHDYCDIYEKYFKDLPVDGNFLEIGYGGYDDPYKGGESARMWLEAYPKINLVVSEIYPKENVPHGVNISYVNFAEPNDMILIPWQDVIIDDGSHINKDIISAFENLWPALNPGGLYCIEDLHSSYDPYYPDSYPVPYSQCRTNIGTAMEYFTRLAHQVNKSFFDEQYHQPYDLEFIHFYKDLIIIKKA